MSFMYGNSNRDLWALIGGLLAVFAALVWRPRRNSDAPDDTPTSEAGPTPEPRR